MERSDNIELFSGFLENKLDSQTEHEFAQNFSEDSQFRSDFKKYIYITTALSTIEEDYIPSRKSKNLVFANLGFTSAAFGDIRSNSSSFLSSKAFGIIASSMTTFIITFFMMTEFGTEMRQPTRVINHNPSIYTMQSNNRRDSYAPLIQKKLSYVNDSKNSDKIIHEKNQLFNETNEIQHDINKPNIESQDLAMITESTPVRQSTNTNISEDPKVPFEKTENQFDTIFIVRSFDSKYRYEFTNTPSWFTKNPIISPSEMNKFQNLSIAVLVPVYKTLFLGVNFRQETFYLEYDGKNSNQEDSKFYQQPNLSTFSTMLRYSPFNISNNIKTIAQIELGLNTNGYVTREMFGLEYYPMEDFYFIIGTQANQFYYSHNSNWFQANKYSLNYGLGVKF